jgi:hypothetical protein
VLEISYEPEETPESAAKQAAAFFSSQQRLAEQIQTS